MFDTPILDVILGITSLWLGLSVICTAATEGLRRLSGSRRTILRKSLEHVFGKKCTKRILALVPAAGRQPPSYIAPRNFVRAARIVAREHTESDAPQENDRLAQVLSPTGVALSDADLEAWFRDFMDRVSGQYKRAAQRTVRRCAVVIALTLNADTIRIADVLWSDAGLRAAIVQAAEKRVATIEVFDHSEEHVAKILEAARTQMGSLPLGWAGETLGIPPGEDRHAGRKAKDPSMPGRAENVDSDDSEDGAIATALRYWLKKLAGLLTTAFALSLGAPFWFDVLKRVMWLRNSGAHPDEPKRAPTTPNEATKS